MARITPYTGGPKSDTRRRNPHFWHEPGIHTQAQIDGWRLTTDVVHRAGGRIVLQIWHGVLANSDLPKRFRLGIPLNTPDPATFCSSGRGGYTDYPSLPSARGAA
ncbi:MAG: hypothetical protein VKI81_07365, partial [Synechococcaceae cyanobacterium]|nr:hypothetical protein [Synechococcaceae cyanobacterium]